MKNLSFLVTQNLLGRSRCQYNNIKELKKIHKNIKLNIKRRTIIVDDQLVFHKSVPIPSWVELSIIDVCNRSCIFCPKFKT